MPASLSPEPPSPVGNPLTTQVAYTFQRDLIAASGVVKTESTVMILPEGCSKKRLHDIDSIIENNTTKVKMILNFLILANIYFFQIDK